MINNVRKYQRKHFLSGRVSQSAREVIRLVVGIIPKMVKIRSAVFEKIVWTEGRTDGQKEKLIMVSRGGV
jgi:hypothetical protein